MKKTFACVAGAIALVSGFGVWSAVALAQVPPGQPQRGGVIPAGGNNPTPPATQPISPSTLQGTRVGVVNINKVLKDYQKAQALNNSIKNEVQAYANRMEAKKKDLTTQQTLLSGPTVTSQQREQIEKQIVNIQRELQDIDNEARKVISKKQGDIAVQIFKEIEAVIKAVATQQGFDMVLSYPDATEPAEMYSQDNIVRKLASQAAMPLFYKPQVDLTLNVVASLNYNYPATQAAPAVAPAGGAPKGPGGQ